MMSRLISTPTTDCWENDQRREDVPPAARADDQHVRTGPEVMAHVGDVVFQVLEAAAGRRRTRSARWPAVASMSM